VAAQQPAIRSCTEEVCVHLRSGRCGDTLPEEAHRGYKYGVSTISLPAGDGGK